MASKNEFRRRISILDILYFICTIAIVVLTVLFFLDMTANRMLVSLVFGLAAVMMFLRVLINIRNAPRGKKSWGGTIVLFVIGLLLLALAAVSFVVLL